MQLTPPPPPPPTPTPTSIRTHSGRVVKSRHIWSYPSNQVCLHPPRDFSHSNLRVQVRDQRIDREFAVGWRGINAQFPRESPAPPMSTPVPPLPTHARAHMTIDEIFETQRLRDKLRKASDEAHAAELTAFMNTNIVPIIRELNDTRARCSALEQHLKRARTSLAGHVVSARPGVARVIPEALDGRGFQSDRSYQRHLATLEGHVRATYPDDEIKQAQLARGLAARMLADTDIAKDQKTKLATDAIISGLQTFYSTLRAKYHTKLPNDASIAQRTIDQAAMAESFDVPASWIAEVLRTDEKRLCREFRSWNAWIDGHEPLALALQKKIRSDKMPFEVADYITNEAWLHEDVTRPSESKLGGLIDPANRTQKIRHRIHWLETNFDTAYAKIRKLTLERFPPDYEFADEHGNKIDASRWKRTVSNTLISNLKHFSVKRAGRSTSLCRYHMQWSNWVSAIHKFKKKLFQDDVNELKTAPCTCPHLKDPFAFRRGLWGGS